MTPEMLAVLISLVALLFSLYNYYQANMRGPDLKLKVKKGIKLSPRLQQDIPFMITNEGSNSGTFFNGKERYNPEVVLPKFLSEFKAIPYFRVHIKNGDFLKIAPGDNSITGEIHIRYMEKIDKLHELEVLFKKHKEVEITIKFTVTTKKGIEVKTQTFKFETELD